MMEFTIVLITGTSSHDADTKVYKRMAMDFVTAAQIAESLRRKYDAHAVKSVVQSSPFFS